MERRTRLAALAATAICLIAAAPAAADRVVTIDGAKPAGTPAALDQVREGQEATVCPFAMSIITEMAPL